MLSLLLATDIHDFWYAVPLIVAISLVYAATRHEALAPICVHAVRMGGWIVSFMLVVFVVLLAMSWWTMSTAAP